MKINNEIAKLIMSALLVMNPKATVSDLAHFLNDYKELAL